MSSIVSSFESFGLKRFVEKSPSNSSSIGASSHRVYRYFYANTRRLYRKMGGDVTKNCMARVMRRRRGGRRKDATQAPQETWQKNKKKRSTEVLRLGRRSITCRELAWWQLSLLLGCNQMCRRGSRRSRGRSDRLGATGYHLPLLQHPRAVYCFHF